MQQTTCRQHHAAQQHADNIMQHTTCREHHAAHNMQTADIAADNVSSVACFRFACCGLRVCTLQRRLLCAQAGGALGGPDALHHNRRQGPRVRAPPAPTPAVCQPVKQPCTCGPPRAKDRSRR
jgi:hypothetical protein